MTEGASLSFVVVEAGGQRWALAMADVIEVIAAQPVTRIPGLPRWLRGLTGWRGRMLAVADLGLLLGSETQTDGPVVVVCRQDVELGLACTAAVGTLQVDQGAMEPVTAMVPGAIAALLAGQVREPSGVVGGPGAVTAVLDVTALLRLRSQLPARHTAPTGLQPGA